MRVAISHNAVGFGFIDRPPLVRGGQGGDLLPYVMVASAAIGDALVRGEVVAAYEAEKRRRRGGGGMSTKLRRGGARDRSRNMAGI